MSSDELRALLDAAGLNSTQASKLIGVGIATITRWLNDETPISGAKAALIRERIKIVKK